MTNEQKLDHATKLIFEVWDELVPDYPLEDQYYEQINATGYRIISDVDQMYRFAEELNDRDSPKWNWDLP